MSSKMLLEGKKKEGKHIHAEKLNTNKSNIIIKLLKKVSKQTNKKRKRTD